jgi:hypothetical protein
LSALAAQVQRDIEALKKQATSARKLATAAESEDERRAQETFAFQCETKAKRLDATSKQLRDDQYKVGLLGR